MQHVIIITIDVLTCGSSNNNPILMGFRSGESGSYTPMLSINHHGNKQTMMYSSRDGGQTFWGGVAMTDTPIEGGDGHHIIRAGWSGSKLYFFVVSHIDYKVKQFLVLLSRTNRNVCS